MSDEEDFKPSIERQQEEASEYIGFTAGESGLPDFEKFRQAKENFALGRAPESQIFRNEDEALEELRERAEARRSDAEADEATEAEYDELMHRADLKTTQEWSEDQQQVLAQVRDQAAAFDRELAQYVAQERDLQKRVIELLESGNGAEARRLVNDHDEQGQRLQEKRAEIERAEGIIQQAAHRKLITRQRMELHRDIPALKDDATRKKFAAWMKRHYALSNEELAAASHDPGAVRRAYKEFAAEKDERDAAETKRKNAAAIREFSKANGASRSGYSSAAEAREALKQSGSLEDALTVQHARRLEAGKGTMPARDKRQLSEDLAHRLGRTI